jgi:Na+/H+ antiporter NhaC
MFSLVMLLMLAFAIGRTISAIGTGKYLASVVSGNISGAYVPVMIFVLGTVVSFCTGTSWGTFSIMMPIGLTMAAAMGANIQLTIGAVISGGVFGDHCSPLSDTTILSSMTAGTDLLSHTKTQLPYAFFCAVLAATIYIVMGIIM